MLTKCLQSEPSAQKITGTWRGINAPEQNLRNRCGYVSGTRKYLQNLAHILHQCYNDFCDNSMTLFQIVRQFPPVHQPKYQTPNVLVCVAQYGRDARHGCRGRIEALGDHSMACPRTRLFARRGFVLERVWA